MRALRELKESYLRLIMFNPLWWEWVPCRSHSDGQLLNIKKWGAKALGLPSISATHTHQQIHALDMLIQLLSQHVDSISGGAWHMAGATAYSSAVAYAACTHQAAPRN